MSQTFIHLNPDIFPNPDKFEPERWLVDDVRTLDNNLVPFSKGPRACLGIKYVPSLPLRGQNERSLTLDFPSLAWAELYLILGNVFRKVGLELAGTKWVSWSPYNR
jgi:hypothetical protein